MAFIYHLLFFSVATSYFQSGLFYFFVFTYFFFLPLPPLPFTCDELPSINIQLWHLTSSGNIPQGDGHGRKPSSFPFETLSLFDQILPPLVALLIPPSTKQPSFHTRPLTFTHMHFITYHKLFTLYPSIWQNHLHLFLLPLCYSTLTPYAHSPYLIFNPWSMSVLWYVFQ